MYTGYENVLLEIPEYIHQITERIDTQTQAGVALQQ